MSGVSSPSASRKVFQLRRRRQVQAQPVAGVANELPPDRERAVSLVNEARQTLLPWATLPNDLCTHQTKAANMFEKLGNVDGAAILIRLARLAKPDGGFPDSFMQRFMAEAECIGHETLDTLSTQSVVVALMLAVLVPIVLAEIRYDAPPPLADSPLFDGAEEAELHRIWQSDLAAFLRPGEGPASAASLRRSLYIAECVLLCFATGMCATGLMLAMNMLKMLQGQIGAVSKVEYLLDVSQMLSSLHLSWNIPIGLFLAAMPLIAARVSATGFFCMLSVELSFILTMFVKNQGRRSFWWSGVLRMHREARAALGLSAEREVGRSGV